MEWTKTREGWYIHVIENHDVYFLFSELVFYKHWMHILYNPLILVFFGQQRPRYMTFNVDDPFQNEVIEVDYKRDNDTFCYARFVPN